MSNLDRVVLSLHTIFQSFTDIYWIPEHQKMNELIQGTAPTINILTLAQLETSISHAYKSTFVFYPYSLVK